MFNVGDLMTTDLFTLQTGDTLKAARSLMQLARIRHIPITNSKKQFIGILTHRDILAATVSHFAEVDSRIQDELDAGIPISTIMRTDVHTVSPATKLRDAAEVLLYHKYGCLPVVKNGILVGIVTEADFLRLTIGLLDAVEEG